MYVRPQGERGIKIPENYSGHAFRDQSQYGDMPPPAHIPTSPKRERVVIPPRVVPKSPHTYATEPETVEDDVFSIDEEESATKESEYKETTLGGEAKASSIFSSLLPAASQTSHFPFGHGIGSEELLILAVMLLVFLSEESDQELLLLLGFLLFAG